MWLLIDYTSVQNPMNDGDIPSLGRKRRRAARKRTTGMDCDPNSSDEEWTPPCLDRRASKKIAVMDCDPSSSDEEWTPPYLERRASKRISVINCASHEERSYPCLDEGVGTRTTVRGCSSHEEQFSPRMCLDQPQGVTDRATSPDGELSEDGEKCTLIMSLVTAWLSLGTGNWETGN